MRYFIIHNPCIAEKDCATSYIYGAYIVLYTEYNVASPLESDITKCYKIIYIV